MEAVMAEEFGDATLETEISLEIGEVQWMRQGVVIQPGPRHTLAQSGCKRSLIIQNLNLSDRGTYRCETLHDRTQVKLNVERKMFGQPQFITHLNCYVNTEFYQCLISVFHTVHEDTKNSRTRPAPCGKLFETQPC